MYSVLESNCITFSDAQRSAIPFLQDTPKILIVPEVPGARDLLQNVLSSDAQFTRDPLLLQPDTQHCMLAQCLACLLVELVLELFLGDSV